MIFFVLSGFLISRSIERARRNGTWSWSWYLSRRLTRLLVVLLPALVLTTLLDRLGVGLFGTAGIYGGHDSGNIIQFAVPSRDGVETLLGNAAFLQEIVVPTYGSNGPLWSLSYEFWYYVLYPVLIAVAFGRSLGHRTVLGAVALATFLFVGSVIASYFAVWLMGVLAARCVGQWKRAVPVVGLLAAVSLTAAMATSRAHVLPDGLASDAVVGLCATILVWAIASAPASDSPEWYGRATSSLAGFAYTLYLVHVPIVVFLRAGLADNGRWQPDGIHLVAGFALAVATVVVAYGIGRLTEFKTDSVRTTLAEVVRRLQRPLVPPGARS
jgi:peptidoglycan/LPS O-acetylase OafA/YrhL